MANHGSEEPFCVFYCLLLGDNQDEFPGIDRELRKRKVRARYLESPWGGRVYAIPGDQVQKLPAGLGAEDRYYSCLHYLGDDKSGHSIYPMPRISEYLKSIKLDHLKWQEL